MLLSIFFSGALFVCTDYRLLSRGLIPAGTIAYTIYTITYAFGWFLWRLDPDSLFGYSSPTTLSALRGMGVTFSVGIFIFALSYSLSRSFLLPKIRIGHSCKDILETNSLRLLYLVFFILLISTISFPPLSSAGMFARDASLSPIDVTSFNSAVTLAKASNLYSRLVPISLLFLPALFSRLTRAQKLLIFLTLGAFVYFALSTGSRTLIFSVPAYLLIGYLFWFRPKLKYIIAPFLVMLAFALPLAEHIRVVREGDPSIADLKNKYEFFQLGKQLIGTSHDFYIFPSSEVCQSDLETLVANDDLADSIYRRGASKFSQDSFQRWHIVGRLHACSKRRLGKRQWDDLAKFPSGLLPKSLGFDSPNLFDGQDLSQQVSDSLDLKPGEISNSTISLYSDAWWRSRWPGLISASAVVGLIFALIQQFVDYQFWRGSILGLLSQMLLFTLLGSWINNTVLTTLWLLFWELPKVLFLAYILVIIIRVFHSLTIRLKL